MAISVNDVEITEAQIAAELPRHQDSQEPLQAATRELILRELMRQKADELGIKAATEDETIGAVLQSQVQISPVTEAMCRQFYEENLDAFVRGESVEASHILFQITEATPLESLRGKAQQVLDEAMVTPTAFAELAKTYSDCPSGEKGGHLGLTTKGMMVPEFEQALFTLTENTICDQLVETRFGLHIVQAGCRTPDSQVLFEEAQARIAEYLNTATQQQVLNQYLRMLVTEANIQGFDMS